MSVDAGTRPSDETGVTLAYDEGIRTLYRYMPFPPLNDPAGDAAARRQRVEDLLVHGDLYLPLASQFNDPFEASPLFRIPRRADGSIDSDVYIYHLRNRYGPQWRWSTDRIAQAETDLLQKIASGVFEAETSLNESTWMARLRNEFPMCCLSSDQRNIPMWAYYAGSHTGVCIHLDATIAPFGAAFKVFYQDDYPFLPQPVAGLKPRAVIKQCLLVKGKAWEHEKEYRLIDMPNFDGGPRTLDPPISVQRTTQTIRFRRRHIVGLTCGARMDSLAIEGLARLCADRNPPIPIWQVKMARHKFEFVLEEVRG